ncbi:hypothetical protein [Massilia psychrophila]|uniref:Uncharacterized protein n=1 Tax=Massilia psychrophila TaxID=1603353 RepID=A0A2G8SZK7_9BURK|nr:hypothetical protein [Massilia psychrophila]PIL39201.1 hypothetical protein CR103_14030 [Massilia psychrophila]
MRTNNVESIFSIAEMLKEPGKQLVTINDLRRHTTDELEGEVLGDIFFDAWALGNHAAYQALIDRGWSEDHFLESVATLVVGKSHGRSRPETVASRRLFNKEFSEIYGLLGVDESIAKRPCASVIDFAQFKADLKRASKQPVPVTD